MRSPLLALLLLLGAAGGAEAASCVVVKDTGERYAGIKVARPDLVGQRFTVTRRASQRKDEYVPSRAITMRLGYEAYELRGKSGTFVVKRSYIPGTPAVQPESFELGRPDKADVTWVSMPGQPAVKANDYVIAGPLTALTLIPARCR